MSDGQYLDENFKMESAVHGEASGGCVLSTVFLRRWSRSESQLRHQAPGFLQAPSTGVPFLSVCRLH